MALFKIKDGVFFNPYKPTIIQITSETTATLVWENGSKIDLEGEGVANLSAWLERQKAPDYRAKRNPKGILPNRFHFGGL